MNDVEKAAFDAAFKRFEREDQAAIGGADRDEVMWIGGRQFEKDLKCPPPVCGAEKTAKDGTVMRCGLSAGHADDKHKAIWRMTIQF